MANDDANPPAEEARRTAARVENNEAESRYEVVIEGHRAVLVYQRTGDRLLLNHTEVPPALEGRGLGGQLARTALEEARTRGLVVVPNCSFVAEYIRRHQEYLPLVAPEERARVTAATS